MKFILFYFIIFVFIVGCNKGFDPSYSPEALEQRAAVYDTLIKFQEFWHYLVSNKDPTGKWTQLNYADSTWPEGRAQLGYGDSDEVTVVSRSYPISKNANMTTYFRKKIFLTAAQITNVDLFEVFMHRDDGAVVYVNGTEKIRSNMPAGVIKYSTPALDTMEGQVGPRSEYAAYYPGIQAFGLKAGWNIIAVEVHQYSVKEKDMSFELTLFSRRGIN